MDGLYTGAGRSRHANIKGSMLLRVSAEALCPADGPCTTPCARASAAFGMRRYNSTPLGNPSMPWYPVHPR